MHQERLAGLLAEAHPSVTKHRAELIGYTLLSMFSNTPSITGSLSSQRLVHLQKALVRSMIQAPLPEPGPASVPAAVPVLRRPAGRRERILEASTRLFDERGFYGVSIDDIAKASEMSLATLYQNVTGKTQVLKAILERGAEGLLYVTSDALALAKTPDDVLDALILTYVRQALGVHGRLMHILANDLLYLSPEEQDDLRETQREYVAEWIEAICALNHDSTPADARALTQAVIGVVTDVSQTPRLRARPGIADELAALALAMVRLSGEDQPPGA
jgi:AcrR family transcriptional regulator